MKKLSTILILSLAVKLCFGQNGCNDSVPNLSETKQLVRDIENYLSEIDSLIECCAGCFLQLVTCSEHSSSSSFTMLFHQEVQDSMLCAEDLPDRGGSWFGRDDNSQRVLRRTAIFFPKDTDVINKYYRNDKLVAIYTKIHSWRGFFTAKVGENIPRDQEIIFFINDGNVVYYKWEKENMETFGQRNSLAPQTVGEIEEKISHLHRDIANPIYEIVEISPQFPGGDSARLAYLRERIYIPNPRHSYDTPQGTLFIGFIVERDGSISNVEVVRSIGNGIYDEHAIRAMEDMPKWIPGKQGGELVRVRYMMPLRFVLND